MDDSFLSTAHFLPPIKTHMDCCKKPHSYSVCWKTDMSLKSTCGVDHLWGLCKSLTSPSFRFLNCKMIKELMLWSRKRMKLWRVTALSTMLRSKQLFFFKNDDSCHFHHYHYAWIITWLPKNISLLRGKAMTGKHSYLSLLHFIAPQWQYWNFIFQPLLGLTNMSYLFSADFIYLGICSQKK